MTTTAPVGLRELKKQRTYEELQRVALELFAARGFDQVTIEDICADAEVSKTTFYRYFDSKEDVLLGSMHEKLAEMATALAERPGSESAIVAVRNAFLEVVAEYQSQRVQKLAVNRIVRTTPSLAARNLEQQTAWENLLREFFVERDGVTTPELSHCVSRPTSSRRCAPPWSTGSTPVPARTSPPWSTKRCASRCRRGAVVRR